jgi:DNA-binding response OmpR family regulator
MTTSLPRPTVLVVEDDLELRPLIAESLEAAGFAAAEAGDATDARARLEGFAYDCLVVDLTLPDGNGMQVLQEAASRRRSTPSAWARSTS